MKVYHTLRAATWGASNEAAGYPAANLQVPRIGRPWRSNNTGGQVTLNYNLSGSQFVAAVALIHCNALLTDLGTFVRGEHPMRKAYQAVGASTSGSFFDIGTGQVDGRPYYEAGYGMVFGAVENFPNPLYGSAEVGVVYPRYEQELPNGLEITSAIGAPYTRIRFPFVQVGGVMLVERIYELALAGPILIDPELTDRLGWWWIVRAQGGELSRGLERYNRENTTLTLREVV